jgi:hypothetical protein
LLPCTEALMDRRSSWLLRTEASVDSDPSRLLCTSSSLPCTEAVMDRISALLDRGRLPPTPTYSNYFS